jgi:hypothetical protein
MKRNAFLITAVLFCFASFATAAEQKKDLASQSAQGEQQVEMARNDAGAGMVHASAKRMRPEADQRVEAEEHPR